QLLAAVGHGQGGAGGRREQAQPGPGGRGADRQRAGGSRIGPAVRGRRADRGIHQGHRGQCRGEQPEGQAGAGEPAPRRDQRDHGSCGPSLTIGVATGSTTGTSPAVISCCIMNTSTDGVICGPAGPSLPPAANAAAPSPTTRNATAPATTVRPGRSSRGPAAATG